MRRPTYAEGTDVPIERSRAELDRILERAGATQRMIGSDDEAGLAHCVFRLTGVQVRLRISLPRASELIPAKGKEPGPWKNWDGEKRKAWCERRAQQAARERWRGLVLLVKAKLLAIESGWTSVDREFLSDVYLPDGKTVHETIIEGVRGSYLDGKMPPLLGGAP